ncbi:CBU_0592 family membrane protein [Lutimonas vermicola]|uniref:CBU-0592-like domain-containing protein n=1 Tax=Lutimonas vermicola TaxID=414288 RepID=A0ABU9KZG2_9FLAO
MSNIDWIGFIGVFQILLAYMLNVLGKISKDDISFMLLNLIGAGMACYASILMNYMPFVVLEGIWAIVSLISLIKYGAKNFRLD